MILHVPPQFTVAGTETSFGKLKPNTVVGIAIGEIWFLVGCYTKIGNFDLENWKF